MKRSPCLALAMLALASLLLAAACDISSVTRAGAELSSISVDQNAVLRPDFDPQTKTYLVALKDGTSVVPTVSAIAANASSTLAISQAKNLTGTEAERTATITVSLVEASSQTTTLTYKLTFVVDSLLTDYATMIPDPALRAGIAANLADYGVEKSWGFITRADLQVMNGYFDVTGYGIKDATGIELCASLRDIQFGSNKLTTIQPFMSLSNLVSLRFPGNLVNSLAPLASFSNKANLRRLMAHGNPIPGAEWATITRAAYPALQAVGIHGTSKLDGSTLLSTTDLIGGLSPFAASGPSFDVLRISAFKDMGTTGFQSLYTNVLSAFKATLRDVTFGSDNLTNADLATIVDNFTQLSYLDLGGNPQITDLSPLAAWTGRAADVHSLILWGTGITDLTMLKALYDAGAFHDQANGDYIDVTGLNLDLKPGTANRDIVDYIASKGVDIAWVEGNITESSSNKSINYFSFNKEQNPGLAANVTATIDEANGWITAVFPTGTNLSALKPSFTFSGDAVTVGGAWQTSGSSSLNFTKTQVYVVTAQDQSEKVYAVSATTGSRLSLRAYSANFAPATLPSYEGFESILEIRGPGISKTVITRPDGIYDIALAPGTYTIHPRYCDPSFDEVVTVPASGVAYRDVKTGYGGVYYYILNARRLTDPDFRKALVLSVDRAPVLAFDPATSVETRSFFPAAYAFDGITGIGAFAFDVNQAQTLAAGKTPATLKSIYNTATRHSTIFGILEGEWEAAFPGLAVEGESILWDAYLTIRVDPAYEFDTARNGWVADSNVWLPFFEDYGNYLVGTPYQEPLAALCGEARTALDNYDFELYEQKLVALNNYLVDNALGVPLYEYKQK